MIKMDDKGLIFFIVLIMTARCEEENCLDQLFMDDVDISCCNSINGSRVNEEEMGRVNDKCFNTTKQEEADIVKCIFKETGIIVDGKVNTNALIAQSLFGKKEADWKRPATDAANTCVETLAKKPRPEKYLMNCMSVMLFVNCPKKDWNENEKCSSLKKNVLKCL